MLRSFILICSGAGLLACSSVSVKYAGAERMDVNESVGEAVQIDSLIAPYRRELNAEMMEVIAVAPKDFNRDRPNGSLNNWACDALLEVFSAELQRNHLPTLSLLNFGGLRNPISEGDVTLGDLYKLMPFDNEVVIVTLPVSVLEDLKIYLEASGGEALGGMKLIGGIWSGNKLEVHDSLQIITSDYLMNGGDRMTFFNKKLRVEHTGVLLRDAFIRFARLQKNLEWSDDERFRP